MVASDAIEDLFLKPTEPTSDDTPPAVDRLPLELLEVIFHYYLRNNDIRRDILLGRRLPTEISAHHTHGTTPFHLGHVCVYWRQATLCMPSLWSSLALWKPTKRLVPAIKLWLDRAHTHPLSLFLVCSRETSQNDDNDAADEILDLFMTCMHQWKEIEFILGRFSGNLLINIASEALVSLESARLDLRYWEAHHVDHLWQKIHTAPLLSRIQWDSLYTRKRITGNLHHIPWVQLTRINLLGLFDASQILTILKSCPGIVSFGLEFLRADFELPGPILVLQHLRTLMIEVFGDLRSLFDRLTLPALVSLSIRQSTYVPIAALPRALNEFFDRSLCNLQEFSFYDYDITEEAMLPYLQIPALMSFDKLQSVQVIISHISESTIAALQRHHVLPNLKLLYLDDCLMTPNELGTKAFSNMILSRLEADYPTTCDVPQIVPENEKPSYVETLRPAEMELTDYPTRHEIAILERLREVGENVVVYRRKFNV